MIKTRPDSRNFDAFLETLTIPPRGLRVSGLSIPQPFASFKRRILPCEFYISTPGIEALHCSDRVIKANLEDPFRFLVGNQRQTVTLPEDQQL